MGNTADKTEAYAASLREYYAMLKYGVTLEEQQKLIEKMHKVRDDLLLSILIDHGYKDLIRYIKETKSLLENRRKAERTSKTETERNGIYV